MEFSDGGFHFNLLKEIMTRKVTNNPGIHIVVCTRHVRGAGTSVDETVIPVLQRRDIDCKHILYMI